MHAYALNLSPMEETNCMSAALPQLVMHVEWCLGCHTTSSSIAALELSLQWPMDSSGYTRTGPLYAVYFSSWLSCARGLTTGAILEGTLTLIGKKWSSGKQALRYRR